VLNTGLRREAYGEVVRRYSESEALRGCVLGLTREVKRSVKPRILTGVGLDDVRHALALAAALPALISPLIELIRQRPRLQVRAGGATQRDTSLRRCVW
jgi:hypothetical protein